MIRQDSLHSTNTWHDIPCAFNQVRQYLCEMQPGNKTIEDIIGGRNYSVGKASPCNEGLMRCDNGECILNYKVYNGIHDCRDSSDEPNGTLTGNLHSFLNLITVCISHKDMFAVANFFEFFYVPVIGCQRYVQY